MTSQEMETILAKPLDAIVGTNRRDGGPHLTPVWFYWDGERFYLSTTRDRAKYPNLKRDPAMSLAINDQPAHRYIVAYGQAELIEENVRELTRPIMAKYQTPEKVAEWEAAPLDPRRVIITLRPERFVSN